MTKYRIRAVALGALLALSLTACQKQQAAAPAVDTAAIADTIKADITKLVGEFNARDTCSWMILVILAGMLAGPTSPNQEDASKAG